MSNPTPLTALRAAADAALVESQGRWRYRRGEVDRKYAYVEWGERDAGYGTALLSPTMARYIAALSPAVVLDLLATLDAERTRGLDVERLEQACVFVGGEVEPGDWHDFATEVVEYLAATPEDDR